LQKNYFEDWNGCEESLQIFGNLESEMVSEEEMDFEENNSKRKNSCY
jgi:hypothetical protein